MKNELQVKLFEQIENDLSKLIGLMPEEDYVAFVEKDTYMRLYEMVYDMEEKKYGVLSDETVQKIADYVSTKLNMYK